MYALSCRSAAKLGAVAIAKGAKGYVGYAQDFILLSQPNKTSHPEKDRVASLFLDPSNTVILALSKGHSPQQAVVKGKQAYRRSIIKALNNDIQTDDNASITY